MAARAGGAALWSLPCPATPSLRFAALTVGGRGSGGAPAWAMGVVGQQEPWKGATVGRAWARQLHGKLRFGRGASQGVAVNRGRSTQVGSVSRYRRALSQRRARGVMSCQPPTARQCAPLPVRPPAPRPTGPPTPCSTSARSALASGSALPAAGGRRGGGPRAQRCAQQRQHQRARPAAVPAAGATEPVPPPTSRRRAASTPRSPPRGATQKGPPFDWPPAGEEEEAGARWGSAQGARCAPVPGEGGRASGRVAACGRPRVRTSSTPSSSRASQKTAMIPNQSASFHRPRGRKSSQIWRKPVLAMGGGRG
jgi:hypothetical protein